MTTAQAAKKWGLKKATQVNAMIVSRKVPGAIKNEKGQWVIPNGAKKPAVRPAGRPKGNHAGPQYDPKDVAFTEADKGSISVYHVSEVEGLEAEISSIRSENECLAHERNLAYQYIGRMTVLGASE